MDMHEIEDSLLRVIETLAAYLPAEQVKEMADLARAGEPGVGFENLCTQLFEYDAPVDKGTLRQLEVIGRHMGIAPKYWERLKSNA
jgi:hypothetical protein